MDWPEFETFCKIKGLRTVTKIDDPKAIIAIAETDFEPPNKDHPWGFYQTVYAIGGKASHGKVDIAQWLEFDATHDMDRTDNDRRQGRITTTIATARDTVKKMLETERYA